MGWPRKLFRNLGDSVRQGPEVVVNTDQWSVERKESALLQSAEHEVTRGRVSRLGGSVRGEGGTSAWRRIRSKRGSEPELGSTALSYLLLKAS